MYIDIQAILGCLQSRSNIQRKLNGLGWFTQRKSSLLWMVSFWDDWSLWQTPFLSLALRWSNLTMTLAMSALAGAEHSFDLPWLVGASATRSCDSDQDWWLLSRMVSLGGGPLMGVPQVRWMVYFRENHPSFEMDDDGLPSFQESSIWGIILLTCWQFMHGKPNKQQFTIWVLESQPFCGNTTHMISHDMFLWQYNISKSV